MKELVGKRIHRILIEDGEQRIRFETDGGPVTYITEGDCCSETWFADILNPQALLGAQVRSVEILETVYLPDDERSRQDMDRAYGIKLTTDKGTVTLVYRNSSNGYYGGTIYLEGTQPSWVGERRPALPPEIGLHSEIWREITEDWSA